MEVTTLRQATYKLFASLFLYPDEERCERIRRLADTLQGERGALEDFAETVDWEQLLVQLTSLQSTISLQEEYTGLFLASSNGLCHPYEGAYHEPQKAPVVQFHLEGEYAREGLALSTDDLPDHVAVQLEFMSFLCGKEMELNKRDLQGSLQKKHEFLDSHLCAWFPKFATRVRSRTQGVYRATCDAAEEFIERDRVLLAGEIKVPNSKR